MKIKSIKLKNFLSFGEEEIILDNLGDLNIIVGPNNSGKTNIFRALRLSKKIINSTNPIPDKTIQYYLHLNKKSEKSNITIEFSISDNEKNIIFDIFNLIFFLTENKDNNFNIRTSYNSSTYFRNFINDIINNTSEKYDFKSDYRDNFFNYIKNIFIEYARETIKKVSKIVFLIEIAEGLFSFKIYLKDDQDNCVYGFDNNIGYMNYGRFRHDDFKSKFEEIFSKIKSKSKTNFEGSKVLKEEIKKLLIDTNPEFTAEVINLDNEIRNIDSKQIYTLYHKINDYLTKLNSESLVQNIKNRFLIDTVIRQTIANSLIFTDEFSGLSIGSFDNLSDLTNTGHEELNLMLYVLKNNYSDQFNEIKDKFKKFFNNIDFDIQSTNGIDKRKVLIRYISNDTKNNLNNSNPTGSFPAPEHKDYNYEDIRVLEPYIIFYYNDKNLKTTFDFASSGMKELLNLLTLTTIKGINKDNVIFMDEPGTTFHPSMQKQFIEEIITNDKSMGQVFIITHSPYFIPSNFLDFNSRSKIKLFRFYKNDDGVSSGCIDINKSIGNNKDLESLRTTIRANIDKIIRAPFANLVIVVEGVEEQMSLSSLLMKYCDFNIADYDIEIIHSHGKGNVDKYSGIFKNWKINILSIKDKDNNPVESDSQDVFYWDNYTNYTELIYSILKESNVKGVTVDNESETKECNQKKPSKANLNSLLLDNLDKIIKEPMAVNDLKKLSDKIRELI